MTGPVAALAGSSDLRLVLAAITAHPMTGDEIEIVCPMFGHKTPGRLLSRLKRLDLAIDTDETRTTRAGNPARVYAPTPGLGVELADPWQFDDPGRTLRRHFETGKPVPRNAGPGTWACPIHRQSFDTPRGLLQHFNRYCDRITVAPPEKANP